MPDAPPVTIATRFSSLRMGWSLYSASDKHSDFPAHRFVRDSQPEEVFASVAGYWANSFVELISFVVSFFALDGWEHGPSLTVFRVICASTKNQKNLFTHASRGFQFELRRVRQFGKACTINNRRRVPPAEKFWADRKMQFVHETSAEQRGVEFAAALAQQAIDLPLFAQPP